MIEEKTTESEKIFDDANENVKDFIRGVLNLERKVIGEKRRSDIFKDIKLEIKKITK